MGAARSTTWDVAVAGAGVIGLACAWRLALAGASVVVAEREAPGAGASGVAAGMLAPVTEASFGEEALLRANLASAAAWPQFDAELRAGADGASTGYRATGAVVVAVDRDDAEELRRLHEFGRALGLDAEWLVPSRLRRPQPGRSPHIAGGIPPPRGAPGDPPALGAAPPPPGARAGGEGRPRAA